MTVFKPTELFSRLQGGHVLVTGNSRLARVLSVQYGQWRMRHGEQQWPSPGILPWTAWLEALWDQAGLQDAEGSGRPVPNRQQLQNLWENVLSDPGNAGSLLRPQALATQALDTRRTAVEWGLSLRHPAWRGDNDENHAAFQRWNEAFESLCRQKGWLPSEELPGQLARALEKGFRPRENRIDLVGFDEFNPAQSALLGALGQAGVQVTELSLEPIEGVPLCWKADDHRHELDRMARWVRQRFSESPDASIAVIVPDLQARRDEIELALQDILVPGNQPGLFAERPWNVSLGTPLARLPIIGSAFNLLALLNDRVEIQTVGAVLRSPWIRDAGEERARRAQLEKRLRDIYPRQLQLREVAYQATQVRKHARDGSELPPEQHEPYPWNCPGLVPVLNALGKFFDQRGKARPPSAWADAIEGLLRRCGWPAAGNAESEPHEHDANWQAYQAWQEALRALASLDATSGPVSLAEAVSRLKRICLEQVFQPRTAPARIQVLGLYEANSLRFDHAWVLGLHSDNWPPPARPNPFIPRQLQAQAGLPHASPQRELEVARTVTARLMETARETVFSYPGQQDGENLLPSPLLMDTVRVAEDITGWEGESWSQAQARGERPLTVPLGSPGRLPGESARGGSSILKNQALCPFRAFAENRLGAEGLEAPVDGISGKLHGTLVHRVLERFWQETQTRDALLVLGEDELEARIRTHVEKVLEEERGLMFRPHFKGVESARLQRLVKGYLELDAARDAFTVEGFEREVMYEINGQAIRLFIDRVDRLADGRFAIIDYKTGRVDPKKWFGERPEDPQLPLYAVSAEEIPYGVVFAVIRNDECVFRGVVQGEGVFPGLPPKRRSDNAYLHDAGEQMEQTVEDWRQILQDLMADFLAGKADIDPKDGPSTCKKSWCELHALCRINELQGMAPKESA
jgi:probable DNA repair protein